MGRGQQDWYSIYKRTYILSCANNSGVLPIWQTRSHYPPHHVRPKEVYANTSTVDKTIRLVHTLFS